jgi:hypothetical protein
VVTIFIVKARTELYNGPNPLQHEVRTSPHRFDGW